MEGVSLKEFTIILDLIEDAEKALGRKLTRGQRRDLLKDNTPYQSDTIAWLVRQTG